jgi:hypothetical protein
MSREEVLAFRDDSGLALLLHGTYQGGEELKFFKYLSTEVGCKHRC